MNKQSILADLQALLPDMKDGRKTHEIWAICHQKYRDDNPDIGGKDFHLGMIDVYDKRIETINNAITFIEEKR